HAPDPLGERVVVGDRVEPVGGAVGDEGGRGDRGCRRLDAYAANFAIGEQQRADHPTRERQGEMTQRPASSAYRRRWAPYLSPGPVTHREKEYPVIRRYDAQRPSAGDDFCQWIVLTGWAAAAGPVAEKQSVRSSSCLRSGFTTSRCRWMDSAPVRGKA